MQRSRGPGRPAQGMACKGSVYALALNAPGSMVIAGTAESLVRVFDSRTGAKVMKLRGHTGNVRWAPIMMYHAAVVIELMHAFVEHHIILIDDVGPHGQCCKALLSPHALLQSCAV